MLYSVTLNGKTIINGKELDLERASLRSISEYLSQHSPGKTEENHESPQSVETATRPRFELGPSQMRILRVTVVLGYTLMLDSGGLPSAHIETTCSY